MRRKSTQPDSNSTRQSNLEVEGPSPPYPFARFAIPSGNQGVRFLDLSRDSDVSRLAMFDLPQFQTPEQLANWLGLSVGKLAWLIHRSSDHRPNRLQQAHYHFHWLKKRRGGHRLIEAPKPILKSVQQKILREILETVPTHPAAHGFVRGRSILSNAKPHVSQRMLIKFDLENFYPSVSFARVVAIFRGIGYSREAALWLARLVTAMPPRDLPAPPGGSSADTWPYLQRHLPQGAPTSPALANLSAFSLDVRLNGMARSFNANYTRYADDLTFSGSENLLRSLPLFIPLVSQIIRHERFRVNKAKRKVIRNNQRQTVTGVVVNERINVSRKEYDRLKAILNNCRKHGPASQNRQQHDDFAAHLHGKVAHVMHLNANRGTKLMELYRQIDW